MHYKDLDEVRRIADVRTDVARRPRLSRNERLLRWAEALEEHTGRTLRPLRGTEYVPPLDFAGLRTDNSPLSVAFDDPVLRADGLKADTVGDAMGYFELNASEIHYLVCSCHFGDTVMPAVVASRIRSLVARSGASRQRQPLATTGFGSPLMT